MPAPQTPRPRRSREVRAAAPRPCTRCPWRTENHGRRSDHNFYDPTNLRRLWAGLQKGRRMTCHPTDPAMAEFPGFEETAKRVHTHECSGALVLIQRELYRLRAAAEHPDGGSALTRYHAGVGQNALTRDGIFAQLFTLIAGRTPLSAFAPRLVNLHEPGISAPGLPPWGECPLDPPDAQPALNQPKGAAHHG